MSQALDLPIVSKNTENIRSKLKRLVSRGILIETEPGLFTQPRPEPSNEPLTRPPLSTSTTKETSTHELPAYKSLITSHLPLP